MDFKEYSEVMQLLYDMVVYYDLALIMDADGYIVADLKGDRDEFFSESPYELLQMVIDGYGEHYPLTIKEMEVVDEITYGALVANERENVRDELASGTHPLYKELVEGIEMFRSRTNILFDLHDEPIHAKEVYVEVCNDGEFENKLLPVNEVENEILYDWCLDKDLYDHGFFETDNRFFNKLASYFVNFTNMYEESIESFVFKELIMNFETLINVASEGLKEYYDLQVAQLMDEENIVQALLANNILYYPNGVMIEHGEL